MRPNEATRGIGTKGAKQMTIFKSTSKIEKGKQLIKKENKKTAEKLENSNTQRSRKRIAELNKMAKELGFETHSALLTELLKEYRRAHKLSKGAFPHKYAYEVRLGGIVKSAD